MFTGADTIDELKLIRDKTIQLLKLGAFELSKWTSNCSELLETNNRDRVPVIIRDNAANSCSFWACNGISAKTHFNFSANLIQNLTLSKRVILSEVVKLFDLLDPVIVIAKLILQDLWLSNGMSPYLRTSTLVGSLSEHR